MKKKSSTKSVKKIEIVHGVELNTMSKEQLAQLFLDTSAVLDERKAVETKAATAEFIPVFKELKTYIAGTKKIVFDLMIPIKVTAKITADITEFYNEQMEENFHLEIDLAITKSELTKSELTKQQKEFVAQAIKTYIEEKSDYNAEYLWDLLPTSEQQKYKAINNEVLDFAETILEKGLDIEDFWNVK